MDVAIVRAAVVVSMLVLLPVGASRAQAPKKLEPVVVTATRVETPQAELGGAVSVVTEEDFRVYHYPTVDEALRRTPGLDVQRGGTHGTLSSVTIRGANPNQVQILIDGARVKNPTSGRVDLSDLSPDLIERIEVIRGPQSTLYGADAIGGVINIITKKGQGPFSGTVQQEVGSMDTLGTRASFSGSYRLLDYAASASHLESNGQYRNDGSDQNALNARLGLSLPWDSSVSLVMRYNLVNKGLAVTTPPFATRQPVAPTLDVNGRQHSESMVTTLGARTRPLAWWQSEARLSRHENTLEIQDAPDPGVACPFLPFSPCEFPARTTVERREMEWLNHFHAGKWSTSTLGLEYRHEEGEAQGSTPFKSRSHTSSAFFQEQLRLYDRLFLTGGVRLEDHSVFGTEVTERGSLAFVVKEWGTKLRGGAGSGFRAPTFVDLFFPGAANPGLKPEESFSYDFGVDQKLWDDRIRLGLTYFHSKFTNLIQCCTPPLPTAPFGGPGNVGRARSAGIELTGEADLTDTLLASLSYTYNDTENLATDRPLARQPQHLWNVGLTWEPWKHLSLFTQVHITTRQFDTFGNVYNSGHTRVDVGGTYRLFDRRAFLQGLDLTARIQNLLDEGYAEVRGFPAPGINALVGLRASF